MQIKNIEAYSNRLSSTLFVAQYNINPKSTIFIKDKKKILVVDDDLDILDALKFMLELENYTVITDTGNNFIKKMQNQKPDLILLDILLSGQDGAEVARRLKLNQKTKHVPIILISAHADARKIVQESRADDFLAKPFEMETLLDLINKHTQ